MCEGGCISSLTYRVNEFLSIKRFKMIFSFIFQFIATVLLGFGIYKGKIEDKDKETTE